MAWSLIAHDSFYDSLGELEETEAAAEVAERLILRVMSAPHRAETIGDTRLRMIRSVPSSGRFPALTLFYVAEAEVVTLLQLERTRTQD